MAAATEAERELHRRLLERDPTATAELAEQYLSELCTRLRRRRFSLSAIDEAVIWDVAVDTLLDLGERPERYNPDKLGLIGYLFMDAYGDLRNHLRSDGRRQQHLTPIDDVEHPERLRNTDAEDPVECLLKLEGIELPPGLSREEVLMEVRQTFQDGREIQTLLLIAEGERHTVAFAALYGLEHLDAAAQQREVKRIKDRVVKKRDRLRGRLSERAAARMRERCHAGT